MYFIRTHRAAMALVLAVIAALITVVSFPALLNATGIDAKSLASAYVFIACFAVALIFAAPATEESSSTEAEETAPALKTLYVGNLPYRANEHVVRKLFEEQGQVHSVRLMKDRQTGKRRGFGFVEMAEADADKAISALNESEFQQRTLKVREAKDKRPAYEAGDNAE